MTDKLDAIVGVKTDRGYTEHEHLDEVGVIHMNGRIYDPLIGRFMSADTIIPNPFDLRAFNRYAYVYNNPLKLFDPTGHDPEDAGGGTETSTQPEQGNAGNAFTCNCFFAVPSLQSVMTGVPDAVLGIGSWGVNSNASMADLAAAAQKLNSPYASFNPQLAGGLWSAANNLASQGIQLAGADGFSLGGQSSEIRGWKAVENAVAGAYREAGYAVEQGVRVVLKGRPGELDQTGVADFIARKEGELVIGEVKDGFGAKFTKFQKALAGDASALERLAIVSADRARGLELRAGEMFGKQLSVGSRLMFALDASAGSRVARQAGEYWGAQALGTRLLLGGLRVLGSTFVTIMTMEANAGQ